MMEVASADAADKQNIVSALEYTAKGWQIFPATPDAKKSFKSKARSGSNWGMTADPDEIRADFTRWPNARIGIPTGAVNAIVVVEIDTIEGHGVDGQAALRQLEAKHGRLPDTLQAISPSGSIHRYFKHPGIRIKNSASGIGAGIDVRGDGGMVIGAGSINPDGRAYRWLNNNPIAAMPDWLVELTRVPPPKRLSTRERATAAVNAHRLGRMVQHGGGSTYAAAALRNEIDDLANAAPGTRNASLNRSAFNLAQLVHSGLLQQAEVEHALIGACNANGLIADDGLPSVIATIRSAFHGAAAKPRRVLA